MGDLATPQDVSRLLGRVAFGATAADLDAWSGRPYTDLVEHLLDIPDPALRGPMPDDAQRIAHERRPDLEVRIGRSGIHQTAPRWWLERCRTTPYPLEERMVLFWHDHFATGVSAPYPNMGMLVAQNQTLRLHALGNFRNMIAAITLDPAMLHWLNGTENTANKPNENFAREFFELFTLGKYPRVYSDSTTKPNDISEAARAFTGWTADPTTRRVTFTASRHDTRPKAILGQTVVRPASQGNVEYLDVIDIALAQDVSPKFVAYKMVRNFGYAPRTVDLLGDPDPLVDEVGAALRSAWDIKAGVRAMMLSDRFRYADPSREEQIVRQPIDLVVSACRSIGITADTPEAVEVLADMGQTPFQPPNVGGWPVGRNWLSPVTMIARYDWGVRCYAIWNRAIEQTRPAIPNSSDLDAWAKRFGLAALSQSTRQLIAEYIAARSARGATENELREGVLILIASSPDWMVM